MTDLLDVNALVSRERMACGWRRSTRVSGIPPSN